MNHRPLLLWPFAVPYHQVSLCAQRDTLCWVCCQAAQSGQRHESTWDLVLAVPSAQQTRPGAGTVLQISWQASAQGTAPVSDEAMVRKSSASERKDTSLQTKGNTHFAVVTTVLCGCKTRTSYSCQGKYFSRFHGCCSRTLVTMKWHGKIPSSEALSIVKHCILKKCS